jgi:hypothetical protein
MANLTVKAVPAPASLLVAISRYIVGAGSDTTEGTMAMGSEIRVGDAEREAAAAQLRDHYADGRLTLEELNERLDQAFAAKTRADLSALTRDLPVTPRPAASLALQPGSSRSRSGGRAFAALAPLLAMFWLCLILGGVFLFGIGGGKPIAVVLFLAALAFLRRLVFRRRRGGRRCGR